MISIVKLLCALIVLTVALPFIALGAVIAMVAVGALVLLGLALLVLGYVEHFWPHKRPATIIKSGNVKPFPRGL